MNLERHTSLVLHMDAIDAAQRASNEWHTSKGAIPPALTKEQRAHIVRVKLRKALEMGEHG